MSFINAIWELIKIVGSLTILALIIGILIIMVQTIVEIIKKE